MLIIVAMKRLNNSISGFMAIRKWRQVTKRMIANLTCCLQSSKSSIQHYFGFPMKEDLRTNVIILVLLAATWTNTFTVLFMSFACVQQPLVALLSTPVIAKLIYYHDNFVRISQNIAIIFMVIAQAYNAKQWILSPLHVPGRWWTVRCFYPVSIQKPYS